MLILEHMNRRDHDAEIAAAQHVLAVVGGSFEIHDTGDQPGQYDVDIRAGSGVSIALEVTNFGGDDWKKRRAFGSNSRTEPLRAEQSARVTSEPLSSSIFS